MPGGLKDAVVAIVGPCPHSRRVQEGWMSRIGAIDAQLAGLRRIYLHFAEHHDDSRASIRWHDSDTAEIAVHPQGSRSAALVTRVCDEVKLVYVHTLHLAEFILPWLESGKVCVDIHGVTPEEEEMLGRPGLRERYEAVEQQVLGGALRCVAVSNAMIEHYREKYPQLAPDWLLIPVFEDYPWVEHQQSGSASRVDGRSELPVAVVYAGGAQVWQNVPAMLELARASAGWARCGFFSHERKQIRKAAAALRIDAPIEVDFRDKSRLPEVYRSADFGLVLRNDDAVNRVACPTKLAEYLHFGVIPIVRSPRLGDFPALGYQYVREEDFKAGFFPDSATREWMIRRNVAVGRAIAAEFHSGVAALRRLVDHQLAA